MADEEKETIKVELEIPKDQVSLVGLESEESDDKKADKHSKKSEEDHSLVEKATGYKMGEIVSAPISPPDKNSNPRPVRGQVRSILVGFLLVIMSLIAWPIFGFATAMAVVLVGASFIVFGTFVRV